jgi:hypothetical protein
MDFNDGPHWDESLFMNGRLTRLHKGGSSSKPPQLPNTPARPAEAAKTVATNAERDPARRKMRGFGSTILTSSMSDDNRGASILGG